MVGRAHNQGPARSAVTSVVTCSLARSAGRSGPEDFVGPTTDGPGRACLAWLGSACDCVPGVCLCGSVPFERSVTREDYSVACHWSRPRPSPSTMVGFLLQPTVWSV